jgi:phosphoglycolate phosphatase
VQENERPLKAILFDKDGTIFDYSRVWFNVLKTSVDIVFEQYGLGNKQHTKDLIIRLMGLDEQGHTLSDGVIFSHNKLNIVKNGLRFAIHAHLSPIKVIQLSNAIVKQNDKHISQHLLKLDFSKQQQLFKALKDRGYIVGIVTVDRKASLDIFLKDMGLEQYIDFTTTRDDHLPNKPNTKSFEHFCEKFNLSPTEVAFVGDTITDMKYATKAKAGLKIGVGWGGYSIKELQPVADVTYETLFEIWNNKTIFN